MFPRSPYTAAKLAGEYYCTAPALVYGIVTVVLRYFKLIFGPRQDSTSQYSGLIPLFIITPTAGVEPSMDGYGDQTRAFTHVEKCRLGEPHGVRFRRGECDGAADESS